MGRLVVVTGVGTEVGKTHLAVALVDRAARSGLRVAGYKPVESGITEGVEGDAAALQAVSTFHVKPSPLFGFAASVSPHLAASRAETPIDLDAIVRAVRAAVDACDLVVVELAGGLFTPLSQTEDNADLLALLCPDAPVLVAQDSLGVLHHVRSAAIAAAARGVSCRHLVLVAPERPDASTGTNADALRGTFVTSHLLPRASRSSMAGGSELAEILRACLAE